MCTRWWLGSHKVCYEPYGCFSTAKPFHNAKGNTPDSPKKQDISFSLNTRANRSQVISVNDHTSISNSTFNGGLKTILIIHGYTDKGADKWVMKMVDEILIYANIIVVDWKKGAGETNYYKSAANTRVVGALAAHLIKDLESVGGISYSNVYVIGHSLGSHIAGYIGEIIPGLGRITGLDPAGSAFEDYKAEVRLDPSDAAYVDVIHTDGESLLQLAFGMAKAVGDADFYPNGGKDQPGCKNTGGTILKLITGKFNKFTSAVACSHSRAIELFTESINGGCTFNSFPCGSWSNFKKDKCTSCGTGCAVMGYHSNIQSRDANVIAVNWQKGAAHINYFKAVANTRVVGAVAAQLIKDLRSVGGISYSNVHVIGHSLGAHTGGYIGEIIPGLGRITGLDPAGLSFERYDIKVRLDPSDATYVDVIHTDGETLFQLAFGLAKAIGDADFYPNGGRNQPGCPHVGNHAIDVITGQLDSLNNKVACSHHRAIDYFTESINGGCIFTSHPCSSESQFNSGHCKSCGHGCAVMGYHTQSSHHHGSFYLTTKSQHSFCR
ncbi:pancreatic lipase-related protein 2-like [Patella vulgata]|uniref:pancreatic lipase-related protein 2-like n=1 Tax=Patella vulgata TaxID=6465 RepID=UPI0024A8283B|nr:pancreatic lipase-related protein 2-like [Patella vulgata]